VKSVSVRMLFSNVESDKTALAKTAPVKSLPSKATRSRIPLVNVTFLNEALTAYALDMVTLSKLALSHLLFSRIPPAISKPEKFWFDKSHKRRSSSLSRVALACPIALDLGTHRSLSFVLIGGSLGGAIACAGAIVDALVHANRPVTNRADASFFMLCWGLLVSEFIVTIEERFSFWAHDFCLDCEKAIKAPEDTNADSMIENYTIRFGPRKFVFVQTSNTYQLPEQDEFFQ